MSNKPVEFEAVVFKVRFVLHVETRRVSVMSTCFFVVATSGAQGKASPRHFDNVKNAAESRVGDMCRIRWGISPVLFA